MKNIFAKLLCAILLVCIVPLSVSCNSGNTNDEPTITSAEVTEKPQEAVRFTLNGSYKLIRLDNENLTEVRALQLLYRGIKSAYGVECDMDTDFVKRNEEVKPHEYEIIVGKTNREGSQKIAKELSYYDWEYSVISPNVIAICGGSPESTFEAVKAFLSDTLGYIESETSEEVLSVGKAKELTVGVSKHSRYTYPITSLKLGERDISEYTVVAGSLSAPGLDIVIDGVDRLVGKKLSVVTREEYKGGPAIFFGSADKNGSHLEMEAYGKNRYYITESGENIIIDFKSNVAGNGAAARFINEYFPKDSKGELSVPLGEKEIATGIYVPSGTNGLELSELKESKVADGITYEERLYYDPNGAPVRVYILTVEKGAAKFETSMPSDGTVSGKVSNMKNQVTAAVNNGKNVICGINADFFDMGGTNVMRGLCIKNGTLIHSASDRPWFGITSDGQAVIGAAGEYVTYRDTLYNAVGGSNIVLRKDAVSSIDVGTDFGDTRHPRTAVGFKADGSIVLMVVDGRQPEISNGASLADIAYLMASLGCTDAINLDGGGSSTFVLKDENGSFNVKNSPSAGALRSVANGLMVVLP